MIPCKKIKTEYIICILILIMVATSIYKNNLHKVDERYLASQGVLDARKLAMDEVIHLDGEWEFYPGEFLEPNQVSNNKAFINVPGPWGDSLSNDGQNEGAGTYKLTIKLPEDNMYAIKTRTIRLASKVYINGEEVTSTGKISLNRDDFIPESKYKTGVARSINNEIELIIQVANFGYDKGGILNSIEFGSFDSINKANNKGFALNVFMVSVCLILAIYYCIIYFQRREKLYLLYFSITNMLMAIYLSTMKEQVLSLLYPYDFRLRFRIQGITMILITTFLLKFIGGIFEEYAKKGLIKIVIIANYLLTVIIIFTSPQKLPISIGSFLKLLVVASYMITYIFILYIIFKSIHNRDESFEYIMIIATSFFAYWILMAVKIVHEVELGNLDAMLIVITLFSVSFFMSHRLQLDYKRANKLSNELIKQDKLKDSFLQSVSHQLQTPLQIILNLSKDLLEGKEGTLNSEQLQDLMFIQEEGERLVNLVQDLLDASQIKTGKLKLRLEPIKINDVIEEILREMKMVIPPSKNIILKNEIDDNFPDLYADLNKFRQVIYNIVNNAIKYTTEGEITVSGGILSNQGQIIISDTGIGIREESYEDIFEIFYKINDKEEQDGLGLGLPISKRIVEDHGGYIGVSSIYGEGSSFEIRFPLYNEEVKENYETIPKIAKRVNYDIGENRKNRLGQPLILIVDSEISTSNILLGAMDSLELSSVLVRNGLDALNFIEHNKVDLIILNFSLPDIPADRVCMKIRENFSMVELPILILAGSAKIVDMMKSNDYGVNDFQIKPIDLEELKSRVVSLLLMKKSAEDALAKEIRYFQSQISPHFLYNTINTIIGLSYIDSEKTRKALENLSIYFRGKLDIYKNEGYISLDSELELVMAYLEIEEMRFGERLTVKYSIEEDLLAMIPPLTLQPIVENAVRHGVLAKGGSGIIEISTRGLDDGNILIIIEDNGIGMTEDERGKLLKGESKGIGFSNVINKIKMIKGASIDIESNLGKGTKVSIVIPKTMSINTSAY
ncbi:MAG: histidine kinase [Epulopiscium sp.]|nr:histidine kinase [Candidatus Epulonipiscium sp.]